ncbi:hypothetical protein [Bartonella tribocorum]|uniref:hypothetical protein n=1 Tax=Bartonella tribocorum TaxID=85701 RepID=UPI0015D525FC|nr:hypothetical protein [Bartonella tribocorum]
MCGMCMGLSLKGIIVYASGGGWVFWGVWSPYVRLYGVCRRVSKLLVRAGAGGCLCLVV